MQANTLKIILLTLLIPFLFIGCKKDKDKVDDSAKAKADSTQTKVERGPAKVISITRPEKGDTIRGEFTIMANANPKPDSVMFILDTLAQLDPLPPYSASFNSDEMNEGNYTVKVRAFWGEETKQKDVSVFFETMNCDSEQPVVISNDTIPVENITRTSNGCVMELRMIWDTPPDSTALEGIGYYSESLSRLVLAGRYIEEFDLSAVAELAQLRSIVIEFPDIKHLDLTPLMACIDLTDIRIHSGAFDTLDLAPMQVLENLETMEIIGCKKMETLNIRGLANCPNLQNLVVTGNKFSSIDLSPLIFNTQLNIFDFSDNNLNEIDLTHLASAELLGRIDLSGNDFRSIFIAPLANCISLQDLDLSNNELLALDMSELKECEDLRRIDLSNNKLYRVILPTSPGIVHVDMSNNSFEEIDLSPLTLAEELRWLTLDKNMIKSIDLTPLSNCPYLEGLWLSRNELTNVNLEPIKICKYMKQIDLYRNQLISIDIDPLRDMTKLWRLDLGSNDITEIDLKPIWQNNSMQEFNIADNNIDFNNCSQILSYKDTHPEIDIASDCISQTGNPEGPSVIRPSIPQIPDIVDYKNDDVGNLLSDIHTDKSRAVEESGDSVIIEGESAAGNSDTQIIHENGKTTFTGSKIVNEPVEFRPEDPNSTVPILDQGQTDPKLPIPPSDKPESNETESSNSTGTVDHDRIQNNNRL